MGGFGQEPNNIGEVHQTQTRIAELPHEILTNIFQSCTSESILQPPSSFTNIYRESLERCLLPLLHTCRRWRQLIEPFLYQRLSFDFETKARCNLSKKLLSTLKTRPYLFSYVREVFVKFPQFHGEECSKIFLEIAWVFKSFTDSVEVLHLSNRIWKDHHQDIFLPISSLPIRKLYTDSSGVEMLFNCGVTTKFGKTIEYLQVSPNPSHTDREAPSMCLNGAGSRSCDSSKGLYNLKSLIVEMDTLAADDADLICQCSEALEYLVLRSLLGSSDENTRTSTYTTRTIQTLVNRQCRSLKSIELDRYGDYRSIEDSRIPDLSTCSCLEVLRLADLNLFCDTPETVSHKLGTQSLRRLDLVISKPSRDAGYTSMMQWQMQRETWRSKFGEERMKWLIGFAKLSKRLYPDSQLRKIYVEFNWNEDTVLEHTRYLDTDSRNNEPWPNAYLAMAKPSIEALGVELTWSTPYVEELDWDIYLKSTARFDNYYDQQGDYYDYYNEYDYYYYDTRSVISMADESEERSDNEESQEENSSEEDLDGDGN